MQDSRKGHVVSRGWAVIAAVLLWSAMVGCAAGPRSDPRSYEQVTRAEILEQTSVPVYGYRILRTYPHDPTSYTEGLTVSEGALYEGTGLYGRSRLRRLDLASGRVLQEHVLPAQYFGEGITVLGGDVYQLTYLSNLGFVYDRGSFALKRTFHYPTQGWGLTTDGTQLIMSNGSAALVFLDPASMEPTRYVIVSREEGPVGFLNELEYIDGKVYANVWQTDLIVVASVHTGKVLAWIDLTGLNPNPRGLKYPFVLNGIARDPRDGALLVTGKDWPWLYAIELVPLKNAPLSQPGALP
jgi:glutaminyl-peptide cyclotransferase